MSLVLGTERGGRFAKEEIDSFVEEGLRAEQLSEGLRDLIFRGSLQPDRVATLLNLLSEEFGKIDNPATPSFEPTWRDFYDYPGPGVCSKILVNEKQVETLIPDIELAGKRRFDVEIALRTGPFRWATRVENEINLETLFKLWQKGGLDNASVKALRWYCEGAVRDDIGGLRLGIEDPKNPIPLTGYRDIPNKLRRVLLVRKE
jgi:hypothetical protein